MSKVFTGIAKYELCILGLSAVFVPKGTTFNLKTFHAWPGAPASEKYLEVAEGPYKGILLDRNDLETNVDNVGS